MNIEESKEDSEIKILKKVMYDRIQRLNTENDNLRIEFNRVILENGLQNSSYVRIMKRIMEIDDEQKIALKEILNKIFPSIVIRFSATLNVCPS